MLTLNRRGWVVRWAYLGSPTPSQTSICKLFWRLVGTISLLFMAALAVSLFIAWFWMYTAKVLMIVGIVVGIIVVIVAVCYTITKLEDYAEANNGHVVPEPIRYTAVYQGIVAIKRRLCPIVEIH